MKTNFRKSILSAAFTAAICSLCLTVNAAPIVKTATVIAISDTGKMSKMSKPMTLKPGEDICIIWTG